MTRLNPQLMLSRLLITKDGKRVYDQVFHMGLNVIRGENGSGKSTVADFIFFALGGELTKWHEEMKLCDFTYAEVNLNGEAVTLRRDISSGAPRRPMAIFWGPIESAQKHGLSEWEVYPFAALGTKQSFSQVLFRTLGIPEVRGELSSRLTMHQLLRLMYADQLTEVTALFRAEQFDSALIRDAVGSLLCGIYDARLYEAQLEMAQIQAQYNQIEGRLDNIFSVLESDAPLDAAALAQLIQERQTERQRLYESLSPNVEASSTKGTLPADRAVSELRHRLVGVKNGIRILEDELETLNVEIADSEQFLTAMHQQESALEDSSMVREVLGALRFDHCPACYSALPDAPGPHMCYLCKADLGAHRDHSPLARIRQELALQLHESAQLQTARIQRREELLQQLPALQSQRHSLQMLLNQVASTAISEAESHAREASMRIGYLDREIHDLQQRLTIANGISSLRESKAELAAAISRLQDEIAALLESRDSRRGAAYSGLVSRVIRYLRADLPREERFVDAERVTFDFGADRIAVNGVQIFAASSMTYLKNSFHLALHFASTADAEFRYPRFTLFDNVEDKGMEAERSHNFQRLVLAETETTDVEHQIILTTSMLAPELDQPELVVGPFYTKGNKTLRLQGLRNSE